MTASTGVTVGPPRARLADLTMIIGCAMVGVAVGGGAVERSTLALAGAGLGLLTMIDLREHRLPDRMVWPVLVVLVVGLGVVALVQGDPDRWGRAALAALVAGILLLIMAVISPDGLGLGDVKLAIPLGFALGWFGWTQLAAGLVTAFVINGLVVGGLVLAGRVRRGDDVAFGPSLVAGALLGGVVVTVAI